MALDKNTKYRNILFSSETYSDFYTYGDVKDLAVNCTLSKEDIVKCRTVGILYSEHGRIFLADMDSSGIQSEFKIRVSVAYLNAPLRSMLVPYPAQVFGTIQWKNRPVIFAKMIQVCNVPMALRIKDIMSRIASTHLATASSAANTQDELIENESSIHS